MTLGKIGFKGCKNKQNEEISKISLEEESSIRLVKASDVNFKGDINSLLSLTEIGEDLYKLVDAPICIPNMKLYQMLGSTLCYNEKILKRDGVEFSEFEVLEYINNKNGTYSSRKHEVVKVYEYIKRK